MNNQPYDSGRLMDKYTKYPARRGIKHNTSNHAFLWASVFYGILGFFLASSMLLPDREFSVNERRRLHPVPQISYESLANGSFAKAFDLYVQDSIAGRDSLIRLKSWSSLRLFGALDDGGIVSKDGSLIQMQKEMDLNSLKYAASVFDRIEEKYLKDSQCHVYVSIIPDKSYFLRDENNLIMDYDAFFEQALQALPEGEQIDLSQTLRLDDYYNTDPHWRQENLIKTAQTLANAMGTSIAPTWNQTEAMEDFKGSLAGRTSLKTNEDSLVYLWNESMKDWTLTVYDNGRPVEKPIYDSEKLESLDPYTFYLQGNSGLAVLENPNSQSDKELIVFRDSFGSAIAPLLADGYRKVTLVDLRNFPSWRLGQEITFTDQDVLFLYSVTVLNASETLK